MQNKNPAPYTRLVVVGPPEMVEKMRLAALEINAKHGGRMAIQTSPAERMRA